MVIINKWKRKYIKLKACILAHKKMRSTQAAFFGTILADRKVYRRFKPILKEHTSVKLTKPRKSKQFDSDIWKDESKESWQNCSIWILWWKIQRSWCAIMEVYKKKNLDNKKKSRCASHRCCSVVVYSMGRWPCALLLLLLLLLIATTLDHYEHAETVCLLPTTNAALSQCTELKANTG